MKYIKLIISSLSLMLIISGCNRTKDPNALVSSHHIKYQVEYIDNMAGDIPTKFLPDEMDAYYSDKNIMTEIEGMFGQFSLIYIADLKRKSVTTLLNFFGTKVYYVGEKGELPAGMHPIIDPVVEITDEFITICGVKAQKVNVISNNENYDVHFTKEFSIKSPNVTTPYYFIDDVLTDFKVSLSYLNMEITMKSHEEKNIPFSSYTIPEDYKEVSKSSMESIINTLFTKD